MESWCTKGPKRGERIGIVVEDEVEVEELCYDCQGDDSVPKGLQIRVWTKRDYTPGAQHLMVFQSGRMPATVERVMPVFGVPGFKIISFRGSLSS